MANEKWEKLEETIIPKKTKPRRSGVCGLHTSEA
jgi:hypothetical protein